MYSKLIKCLKHSEIHQYTYIRNRVFVKNCILVRIILDENKIYGNRSTLYGKLNIFYAKLSIFYINIYMQKSIFFMQKSVFLILLFICKSQVFLWRVNVYHLPIQYRLISISTCQMFHIELN